jgi:hypothetical protein
VPYTEPERMATFINLILKLSKKTGDINSRGKKAAIDSQLTLVTSRKFSVFF